MGHVEMGCLGLEQLEASRGAQHPKSHAWPGSEAATRPRSDKVLVPGPKKCSQELGRRVLGGKRCPNPHPTCMTPLAHVLPNPCLPPTPHTL